MNQQFRGGMQVHAVPNDERFVDSTGRTLPWGYMYPDSTLNRKQPVERGPFGKTTNRRTLSRSKTATPATKEDLLRLENQRFQDDVFARFKAEHAEAQSAVIPAPQRDTASHRSAQELVQASTTAQAKQDTRPATFSEPTEILLYGYLPSHLPSVLTFYETASLGVIYEDYDRAPPPSQNPRYSSGLLNMANARIRAPRNLTSEALAQVNTFRGGHHWIKVTFDSPLSAQRAMSASPHTIGGCDVFACPWTGAGPAQDVALPAGRGGVAGTFRGPAARQAQAQADRGFSSFPTRLPKTGDAARSSGLTDSTSSTEGADTVVDATSREETAQTSSTEPVQASSSLRQRNVQESTDSIPRRREPRVRSARTLILRPAEEAFLPTVPWSVRTFGWLPLIGLLVGGSPSSSNAAGDSGIVGSAVPKTEQGEFDWARASFWWVVCWYIDFWLGCDLCGLKGED